MNDTPQGDGNWCRSTDKNCIGRQIRMNDTPQGDGNILI